MIKNLFFIIVFVFINTTRSEETTPKCEKLFPTSQVPTTFKHIGLLNTKEELDIIKRNIEAGNEPWKTAFEKVKTSRWCRMDYIPHPVEIVSSDLYGANDHGAAAETDDSVAAYGDALLWYFTGNQKYAEKSVQIINAWSSILQTHKGMNWYLQTAWAGSTFPEAAEILRATFPQWRIEDKKQFSLMLNRAFLPLLHNRVSFGNRELSVCNALVAIGVYNNDRAAFYEGICHWISYVPCYYYLSEDGLKPRASDYWRTTPSDGLLAKLDANLFPEPDKAWFMVKFVSPGEDFYIRGAALDKIWFNPNIYIDGLCAETCRDFTHCENGFAAAINVAEIAWHQGIDLYSIHQKRLTRYMEFNNSLRLGKPIPNGLHEGKLDFAGMSPTFEIAYNHYHNRKKIELPSTHDYLIKGIRLMKNISFAAPQGIKAKFSHPLVSCNPAWETLTHAELDADQTRK